VRIDANAWSILPALLLETGPPGVPAKTIPYPSSSAWRKLVLRSEIGSSADVACLVTLSLAATLCS
jgi:hypothetical protein